MKRHILFVLFLLFAAGFLSAQNELRLEDCIEIAVENNLGIQQGVNSLHSNELNYIQKKFDFLPGVSASANVSKSFGRTVDNFTQTVAQSPWNGSPSIGASLTLFQGFSKWNRLKGAEMDLSAARYSLEDMKNDIRMNTALAFFQVVFAKDQLKIAEARLNLLEQQLERVEKQFQAGQKTQGDVYNVKAQLSTEKVNVLRQKNTYKRNLLDLILAMNLDPEEEEWEVVRPQIEGMIAQEDGRSIESVFDYARTNNPGIRKQEMTVLSRKYATKTARAGYLPTLRVNYGMGSFYSSNDRGEPRILVEPDGEFSFEYGDRRPLGVQLEDNFNHQMSFSLSVPIFSNLSIRQSYRNSIINHENALLQLESEENDLYKQIQQAWLDMDAARAQYDATKEQLMSLQESYSYAEARYGAGLMDFYTYIEIVNNKTEAEINLIQAQYDYLLKQKILDLYQGKPLSFE